MAIVSISPPANAGEIVLSFYPGRSLTFESKVELDRPDDTSLEFHDVSWDDQSFRSPIYYGLRIGYWIDSEDGWGLVLDFVHAKMFSELDDVVSVTGRRNGLPVGGMERLSDTFAGLSFSHGHNLLLLTAARRWSPWKASESSWIEDLRPYVGLGGGIAVPHVEVRSGGTAAENYQLAGPAFQGLAGIGYRAVRSLEVFMETKISFALLTADLEGGGELRVSPWTFHLAVGATLRYDL